MFDEAAVIIWACGYTTNICPIYESDGLTQIQLCYDKGQVEVDDLARILTKKIPMSLIQPRDPLYFDEKIEKISSDEGSQECSKKLTLIPESSSGSRPGSALDNETKECEGDLSPTSVSAKISNTNTNLTVDLNVISNHTTAPTISKSTSTIMTSVSNPVFQSKSRISQKNSSPSPTPLPLSIISPVGGLLGSGLGFGLKATLDNGEADGSSGRADGVAVYLKHGATLVLAHVLGESVYGGYGITSWDERISAIKRLNQPSGTASATPTVASSLPLRLPLSNINTKSSDSAEKSDELRDRERSTLVTSARDTIQRSRSPTPSPECSNVQREKDKSKDKERNNNNDMNKRLSSASSSASSSISNNRVAPSRNLPPSIIRSLSPKSIISASQLKAIVVSSSTNSLPSQRPHTQTHTPTPAADPQSIPQSQSLYLRRSSPTQQPFNNVKPKVALLSAPQRSSSAVPDKIDRGISPRQRQLQIQTQLPNSTLPQGQGSGQGPGLQVATVARLSAPKPVQTLTLRPPSPSVVLDINAVLSYVSELNVNQRQQELILQNQQKNKKQFLRRVSSYVSSPIQNSIPSQVQGPTQKQGQGQGQSNRFSVGFNDKKLNGNNGIKSPKAVNGLGMRNSLNGMPKEKSVEWARKTNISPRSVSTPPDISPPEYFISPTSIVEHPRDYSSCPSSSIIPSSLVDISPSPSLSPSPSPSLSTLPSSIRSHRQNDPPSLKFPNINSISLDSYAESDDVMKNNFVSNTNPTDTEIPKIREIRRAQSDFNISTKSINFNGTPSSGRKKSGSSNSLEPTLLDFERLSMKIQYIHAACTSPTSTSTSFNSSSSASDSNSNSNLNANSVSALSQLSDISMKLSASQHFFPNNDYNYNDHNNNSMDYGTLPRDSILFPSTMIESMDPNLSPYIMRSNKERGSFRIQDDRGGSTTSPSPRSSIQYINPVPPVSTPPNKSSSNVRSKVNAAVKIDKMMNSAPRMSTKSYR